MMTLHDVAVALIEASTTCELWTRLVKDLALSDDPDLPQRIAEQHNLGVVDKATGQNVNPTHLRQIIVSRMEAANREFQALYNVQFDLVATGRATEPATPPRVPCAACDRGNYQLGHADGCPAITTQPSALNDHA